jgi:hypothetical protein
MAGSLLYARSSLHSAGRRPAAGFDQLFGAGALASADYTTLWTLRAAVQQLSCGDARKAR